ncbi:MAG: putative lipid II flippase FtsW [Limnochordia bacterium]|jgi:cell division protein FtsW|nr:putative lipid II flippase FtsW [Limnochordia bacterium]MDI9465941.1 putative lipid II flippase FtsW [Bacillota bacterium]NLO94504.1 putative lipid II flippase FtsW [Bacillota bacterium]HAI52548.1 putative lipid II flippase FtsW [Bacillota bacterium]HOB40505.1 putative lipid II flippase FtsW [Limnochordia bacterium]
MFTKGGKPDLILFLAVIALVSLGLIMVFSASSVMGLADAGNPYYYVQRQSILAVLGLVILFVLMKVDYHIFKPLALPGLVISLALLVLVLFVGTGAGSASRWIRIAGFNLQPSELAKLILVNYVAVYLANKRARARKFFSGLLPILVITAVYFVLIMLEPDFGTAVALVFSVLVVLFAGGVHLGQLTFVGLLAAPVLAYLVTLKEYRVKRLFAFLDPWADPTDTGWNVIQSLLAIGSGGLFGVGLGRSRQKFSYLPEHHTDFIFAILCEELGFLGGAAVIVLFFVLAWRGLRIAMRAPDLYGTLLAIGITSIIAFQALLNIGVVTGSLPVTGIPLPFISHGGSSLLVSLAGMGILLNISRQSQG